MEKMTCTLRFKHKEKAREAKVRGKSVLVREMSGAKVLRWLSFGVLTKEKEIREKGEIRRQSTGFYTHVQDFGFYSECDGKLSR